MTIRFGGFDQEAGNWPKCGKHGVSQSEIEEVFLSPIKESADPCSAGIRKRAVGITRAGRHVFLVFTIREKDGATLIRPVSARYMHKKEIETCERTSS